MKGLNGRTAIVTGASRGIGLAVAQRLVDEGANVVITARNAEPLEQAAAALGENAHWVAGKADDPAHQDEVVAAALSFGSLDFLVNNTGINPAYGPLLDVDADVARKIMDVNVIAALSWVQKVNAAALPSTAERSSTSRRSPVCDPHPASACMA